jgi:crotonobetainyl-CoA:carnitine CoA-transferase CaiB-like acyl-CoA transferase
MEMKLSGKVALITGAPIHNLAKAAADPDVIANEYITEVDHPKVGKIKEVSFTWKFSKTPAKAGIAPELGEHNHDLLKKLGYSDLDIEQLRNEGII